MKAPRHRLLLTLLYAACLAAGMAAPALAALGQQGHNPFGNSGDPPPTASGGTWELVDQRELAIEGELVALSPDGLWIAGIAAEPNRFCVWNVATGDAQCDEERQPIAADSIAWAPDSSAVAYSLNVHRMFYDSDLFVFELAAGRSVNLTDDGFADGVPIGNEIDLDELPLDAYPAWTPDGASLVFARTDWLLEQPTTELMTIDRQGGEPALLHVVRDDFPLGIASPIFPLADGSILYSVFVNKVEDPGNGVWRLDAEGQATQLLPGAVDERFPLPSITDVRDGASEVIASGYSYGLANNSPGAEPYAFELDLASGTVTPSGASGEVGLYQTPFAYAPDGASAIAFEILGDERRLVITGPDGARLDLGVYEVTRYVNSRGIAWAANDTILVPGTNSGGVLLSVEPRP